MYVVCMLYVCMYVSGRYCRTFDVVIDCCPVVWVGQWVVYCIRTFDVGFVEKI